MSVALPWRAPLESLCSTAVAVETILKQVVSSGFEPIELLLQMCGFRVRMRRPSGSLVTRRDVVQGEVAVAPGLFDRGVHGGAAARLTRGLFHATEQDEHPKSHSTPTACGQAGA